MGTPHRGSGIATAAKNLTALANLGLAVSGALFFVSPMRTDLLRALQRESSTLEIIQDDFSHLAGNLTIISCYETEIFHGLQRMVSHNRSPILIDYC
jgi:hypothetical protein